MDGQPTDEDLVARTLGGDRDAFGILAERYYRMLWFLAYQKTGHRTDAEDVVQEAFVRAFRGLEGLRNEARFSSWLYNIALKLCIDLRRRRDRRDGEVSVDHEVLGRTPSGRFGRGEDKEVGCELEAAEEHARALEAVGGLPDKYRLVVTLRYVKRMSYKQIAEHLGEPAGTIANRLHRAVRMLQSDLLPDEAEVQGEGRR